AGDGVVVWPGAGTGDVPDGCRIAGAQDHVVDPDLVQQSVEVHGRTARILDPADAGKRRAHDTGGDGPAAPGHAIDVDRIQAVYVVARQHHVVPGAVVDGNRGFLGRGIADRYADATGRIDPAPENVVDAPALLHARHARRFVVGVVAHLGGIDPERQAGGGIQDARKPADLDVAAAAVELPTVADPGGHRRRTAHRGAVHGVAARVDDFPGRAVPRKFVHREHSARRGQTAEVGKGSTGDELESAGTRAAPA